MRKVFQAYQSTNTATPPNPQKKKEDLNSAWYLAEDALSFYILHPLSAVWKAQVLTQ
jgi:hypothetical protein